MNRIALTLALAAGISCAAFGYEPQRHNDTFTTNGITYAQRGGLGVKDFVVTNIDAEAVGKVKSVNGRVGDVVLDAAAVNALPDDKDELVSNPTFSNAVLEVGLNIDTNSVAVLNEIAATFGGFPIEGTATTVGGLLAALAAAIAWLKKNKRDKYDLAVYKEQPGHWTHGELVEGYKITAEQPEHDSSLWFWYGAWIDSSGHYTSVAQAPFVSEDQTNIVFTVNAHPSGNPSGFTFTATRTASIVPKSNQRLAAVAKGDAQTPVNDNLVKYDATNDRIVKAIPSSSDGELADYRDPKDAKCYESVDSWTWEFSDGLTHELPDPVWNVESPVSHWTVGSDVPESPEAYDENATSLRFIASQTWPKDYSATATRHLIATKDKPFVTADNAARSLECGEGDAKQTVTVENGVAKLDDFFGESNSLLNGRLAYSRNATGLKDRAFNALTFDGTEYNLSTALEAVTPTASGQPRDLLIVATATAATTISFTAGTIKGDKPTIDGSGTWLITLTEYASGVWYCRQIKMEDAA